MTTSFRYRALEAGHVRRGLVKADDESAVVDYLRRHGLRPVEVSRDPFQMLRRDFRMPGGGGKRAAALALFARQFSTMVNGGTPLLVCLEVLADQSEDESLSEAVRAVARDVESGDQLSVAMARQPAWFDDFVVSLIRAGEPAGALDLVLLRLADATERATELRRKVKSALSYPAALAVLISLAVLAMMLFLVPTFVKIYEDLDGTLPLPTQIVTGISTILTDYFLIVAAVVAVTIFGYRRWKKTPSGERRVDGWKIAMPVFGPLFHQTSLARFTRSLSVLVSSGVPVDRALGVAGDTAGNTIVGDAVKNVVDEVSAGQQLSAALGNHEVFSPMVIQMVAAGERGGVVEDMLDRVADLYDDEVSTTVDSLTAVIEPLLLVVMGLVVGGVLLAVYLPMFSAIDLIR